MSGVLYPIFPQKQPRQEKWEFGGEDGDEAAPGLAFSIGRPPPASRLGGRHHSGISCAKILSGREAGAASREECEGEGGLATIVK